MLEINEKKKRLIEEMSQEYSLELLVLFGSQVTGKTHKESDYDIGYLSSRKLSIEDEGRMINALLPVVDQYDERIVNLVNVKKAPPLLLYSLTSQAQVLFESEPTRFARLRAFAYKQYVETKPMREEKYRRMRAETEGS